ncbi:hypothetical protein [Cytobacillus sp. IB215665]|uniref:hypothetical protein n=1 Tax=Cytobacillus sp. IB215665 TaxID=3097357 RepID=UPI002A143DBA|nr:hypothetical protein [Cytobacillus sp. IB215665]MDX8367826.1 hypothetical protein [Cytobacillus sp. IB215665]
MEHPSITKTMRTGYSEVENKPKRDYYDEEIYQGEKVWLDSNTGNLILKCNLAKYITEHYDFDLVEG